MMTRRHFSFAARRGIRSIVALALLAASASAATVQHRYTFNDSTANDSILANAMNGTVIDPGGIAIYTAGRLDLRANNAINGNTNPPASGAFVDLPDGVFTSTATTGTGAISVVAWVNIETNRQNARIWSFGNSAPNGGDPFYGQFTDWVDLNGQNGNGSLALTTHDTAHTVFDATFVTEVVRPALPVGTLHQVVATLDQADTNGGVNPNGTMRLYVNSGSLGANSGLVGSQAITSALSLTAMTDVNNWLGRSQWGDFLFDGQIDEVALYSGAMTGAEVAANFTAGPAPAPIPIPTFVVDRGTGQIRIENHSAANFRIKSYSITSPAGALNPTGWVSVADLGDSNSGSGFDSSGVWTESSATPGLLAESTPGLGGNVAAGTGVWSLGPAWLRTPTQDLQVTYTLSDNSTGTADVSYTGVTLPRSDFNGDGTVTAADWDLFLAGSNASYPGLTGPQAYLKGDLDADLDNDFRDYRLFKADYIAANGPSAWEALGAVPEPTAAVLVAIGLAAFSYRRGGRTSLALAILLVVGLSTFAGSARAADPVTYIASGDPGAAPDANAQAVDVWTTVLGVDGGRGSGFFQPFPSTATPWALFSYPVGGINGSVQADHTFVGGPLAVGQAIKLDFGNRGVAAGGSVGVSLLSAGTPVVTFKFNGADPQHVYRYDDLGGADQSTGEPFAFQSYGHLEFSLSSASQYIAAYNLGAWTGTYSGPIDGVRVFNNGGGDASDVGFNNLQIGAPTLVPLSLEVNKTTGLVKIKGNATLSASLDYYKITSAGNALAPTTWSSLDDQNLYALDGGDNGSAAGDSVGEGWDESDNASVGSLSEYFLRSSGASLGNGSDLSLGTAYNKNVFGAANGDLQFVYGISGGPQLTGTVTYVTGGAPVVGDYNGNGTVDAPDLLTWRGAFGTTVTPGTSADGTGDGRVDGADLLLWQRRLGATTAVAAGQPVPEAATSILLGVALLGGCALRRR